MHLSRLAVPLAALAVVGCASAPANLPPAPPWAFAAATPTSGSELRMRSQDKYIQVTIDGPDIYGSTFSLKHAGAYIRGTGVGQSVIDVKLSGTHAAGSVSNQPLTVDLQPEGNGVTHVTGLFAGAISDFRISPTIFQGKLGICSYEFAWSGVRYEGKVSCGSIQQGSLELPVAMASWTDLEVATLLAILLGS
jgi:hypothetical protein